MSPITLSELHFYPVKSCRGISLERSPVGPRGIRFDRHWMVVDAEGNFLTQRQHSAMSQIQVGMVPGGLRLTAPGMPELDFPVDQSDEKLLEVQVWGDRVEAEYVGSRAANWLSHYLGIDARLVFMPEESRRPVDPDYAAEGDEVGFADGFPFLLISEASLQDLNSRLDDPLLMRRFRPNLVVQGCEPYEEDSWRRIRIGDIEFRVVKPCSRCLITTIDPESGEKGSEPLKTLASYRRRDNQVYFGQNLIHGAEGELQLGMTVEVLEHAAD